MTTQLPFKFFDCDNHYYEALDAFTRHIEKQYAKRTMQWAIVNGKERLLVGGVQIRTDVDERGVVIGRGQRDAKEYFLGRHAMPWWAVMASIVATETSTATFLSVPGVAYKGDLTYLQLPMGYLIGRVIVAIISSAGISPLSIMMVTRGKFVCGKTLDGIDDAE